MPALFGALALVLTGQIPLTEVINGLTADLDINPLKILVLFFSMTIISVFLDETGFFHYLANLTAQRCGRSQVRLFIGFYFLIALVTFFTSNDIVTLTFTPFICYFAKNARINPIPYLFSQFVSENTASMYLIIGNPTNIYLGTMAGIDFFTYFVTMLLPTTFAMITALVVLLLIFRKQLKQPMNTTNENVKIDDKYLLVFSLSLLIICMAVLAFSGLINIAMWFISLVGLIVLIIGVLMLALFRRRKPKELFNSFLRAPYDIIPLVISMFIIVLTLEASGITSSIAGLLNKGNVCLYLKGAIK